MSDQNPSETVVNEAAELLASILLAQILEAAKSSSNPFSYGNQSITPDTSVRHHEQDLPGQ